MNRIGAEISSIREKEEEEKKCIKDCVITGAKVYQYSRTNTIA